MFLIISAFPLIVGTLVHLERAYMRLFRGNHCSCYWRHPWAKSAWPLLLSRGATAYFAMGVALDDIEIVGG